MGILTFLLAAPPAAAGNAPLAEAVAEMTMGRDDAPVTMIEYSSLACPHCAAFHRDVLPRIKETYIGPGKVRLVFRDFPLGGVALAAAMVARCGGPEKYFGFVEVLFRSQAQWARSDNPRRELARVARFGGISQKDFDACLVNEPLMTNIRQRAADAQKTFGIDSTPTFIIDGEKVLGARPFEDFRNAIEKALEKKR
ncbi:MAG: DsbA family protein [Rhodospirillales bacterium]